MPTQAEIAEAMGLRSLGMVRYHLAQLEKKGRIIVYTGKPRAIILLERGQ